VIANVPNPHGTWTQTTLSEFCGQRGQSVEPSKTPDSKFELYSVPSFPTGQPEIVHGKAIGSNKQLVTPDSVLLCKINPRINRAWIVGTFSRYTKIASTEWIVFPRNERLEPKFLSYFLQQNAIRDFLASNVSGVGGSLMRVKPSTLRDFPFAYPERDNQRTIVAEIEKHVSRLDEALASLKRVKANLKRYKAAVLKAAVEGKLTEEWRKQHPNVESASKLLERILTERRAKWTGKGKYKQPVVPDVAELPSLPKGWTWATFEQISSRVTVGHVGPMKHEYIPRGVPFLRSQNIRENKFDPEGLLYIPHEFHVKLSKSVIHPGDLAVVRSGSVGVTCVIPETLSEANCADLVLIQQPHGLVPQFGAYYMNSLAKRRVQAGKVGVALTHFNTKSVAAMPVPVPPLTEQQRIVAEVERRLSVIDELETAVDANLTRADRLRQSILQRAFTGDLI